MNPQQIEQLRTKYGVPKEGYTPVNNSAPDRLSELNAAWGVTTPKEPNDIVKTGQNLGEQYSQATDKIKSSVTQGAADLQAATHESNPLVGIGKSVKALGEAGLGTAAGAVQAIFAPISAPIQTLIHHVTEAAKEDANSANPDIIGKIVNSPQIATAKQTISDWATQHPELARTLGDAFTVGTAALGSSAAENVLNKPVGDIAKGLVDTAKTVGAGLKSTITKTPEEVTAQLTQQTIKDATPAYSKNLIGEPSVNGTPRIQEGGGVIKTRTVTPTTNEIAAGNELAKVPNYPVKGTALEKFNSIEPEITKEAQTLNNSLKNENVLRPPKEISKIIKTAVNDASENSVLLQKTDPIVKNYMRVANRAIEQSDGTLAGELKVRQILDNAYEDAGGKYGNNKGLDQIHRAARNALNDDLEAKAISTEVKASLKRQSNLYRAADVLQDKAKLEGGTALEQLMKKSPNATKVVKAGMKTIGLGAGIHLIP